MTINVVGANRCSSNDGRSKVQKVVQQISDYQA